MVERVMGVEGVFKNVGTKHNNSFDARPRAMAYTVRMWGRALLFQHRILHVATEVVKGAKFVLRTVILYGPA